MSVGWCNAHGRYDDTHCRVCVRDFVIIVAVVLIGFVYVCMQTI